MSHLRVVTWNCRSGSAEKRFSELASYDPHLVFLQECRPEEMPQSPNVVCRRSINRWKDVVLMAPASSCQLGARAVSRGGGRAAVTAQVEAPLRFVVLGIWARGPRYVDDVMRTLQAHANLLRSGPALVMGDFNSGSRLGRRSMLTRHHNRLLEFCAQHELVSAYHAFHGIDPGNELHATYYHQFRRSQPWHIDLCFIPQAWLPHLVNVTVIDGPRWARRSDHRPLLVELSTALLATHGPKAAS